jgi:hypothetical protein
MLHAAETFLLLLFSFFSVLSSSAVLVCCLGFL